MFPLSETITKPPLCHRGKKPRRWSTRSVGLQGEKGGAGGRVLGWSRGRGGAAWSGTIGCRVNGRRAAENERKGREDPRGGFVGGVQVVVRGAERRRASCLAGDVGRPAPKASGGESWWTQFSTGRREGVTVLSLPGCERRPPVRKATWSTAGPACSAIFLVGLWASSRVSMLDDVVASRFAIIERKFEIVNAKKAWLIVDRVVVYHWFRETAMIHEFSI